MIHPNTDTAPEVCPRSWRLGQRKDLETPLRMLDESRAPGQSFSARQIADACGVHHDTIDDLERRALAKFARRLHSSSPAFFAEIFEGRGTKDITAVVEKIMTPKSRSLSSLRGGKKNKSSQHLVGFASDEDNRSPLMSLTAVAKLLEERNGSKRWGKRKTCA